MRGRGRPPLLEPASKVAAAGNKSRIDGWRQISEESMMREVCHHLKWAQEMKDMYERQVAVCQKQLQEHQQQNPMNSGADAGEGDGDREMRGNSLPSSSRPSRHRKKQRQPYSSGMARALTREASKLPRVTPRSYQRQKVLQGKRDSHCLPVMHRPVVTPASARSQGRPPVNLVSLPALREPSSVNKVVDRQQLQFRGTVKPSLLVHQLFQVKVPEEVPQTPSSESDDLAVVTFKDANSAKSDQQQLRQQSDPPVASSPPRSVASRPHAASAEEKQRSAKDVSRSQQGKEKKARQKTMEPKPAQKKKRGNYTVTFAAGVKDSEAEDGIRKSNHCNEQSDTSAGVTDLATSCRNRSSTCEQVVGEVPAGVKDEQASGDAESDDADDESNASSGSVEMALPTGREVDATRRSVRRGALRSDSKASQDVISIHFRMDVWSSIFKRLQDDGEVHRDQAPWALQLSGYPKPNTDWVHEILTELTPYSTLDLDEFVSFMQLYETREHQEAARLFAEYDLDRSGTIDMGELSLLMASFGVTPLSDAIREIVQDVSPADADELTFDEFWQVLIHLHEHEGFAKSEVETFKVLFQKFDVNQSGTINENELYRMLAYMGYELDRHVTQCILQEVDADGNGSLDEREFLVCMRKVREHEVAKVQEVFRRCDADGSGSISYDEIFTVLRSLGYFPGEEEIMDAYDDAGLDPDNEMLLDDLWKFLHIYREREGFSRKDMEGIAQVFYYFDKDGSGELETSEVVHMLLQLGITVSCNQAQCFVANVDIAGSGTIDLREFTKILRQHHQHEAIEARDEFCSNDPISFPTIRLDMLKRLVPEACEYDANRIAQDLSVVQQVSGEVDKYEFVNHITELHAKARRSVVENHGFAQSQVFQLRKQFAEYDVGKKGFLVHREVHNLLEHLFPRLATCAAWRPQLVQIMQDAKIQGSIDVDSFLRLAEKCRELQARDIIKREKEAIERGKFSPLEVKEFRDLFTLGGTHDCLSLHQMREMLAKIIPMGYKNSQQVAKVFREIVAEREGKLEADFSEFLLILRRLIDLDIACINECARRARRIGDHAELT